VWCGGSSELFSPLKRKEGLLRLIEKGLQMLDFKIYPEFIFQFLRHKIDGVGSMTILIFKQGSAE